MKKTEKMIHQNIRFRSRIDTFLVSIEEFPSPTNLWFSPGTLRQEGDVPLTHNVGSSPEVVAIRSDGVTQEK